MLLSFSANTLDQVTLEKTLVGRKEVVDRVEQELLEKALLGQTYQSLLIAPRGSGKTHITKLLHYRLKNNPDLDSKIFVAYMNEDERGIANYSDFIRHILQSFVKHKEGKYEILMDLIYEVSGLPINKQEVAFENILLEFIGTRGLVILIENINILFDKKTGMGPDGQEKLRSLMHEHNQFSLLATSQSLFYHIQDAKGSFYNFFNIRHLEKLDFKNAFEFIKMQASLEKNEVLNKAVEQVEFKAKVRAIYQLTGGNHRLLVSFFTFLKTNLKSELSKVFVKTMNDLKPYYEQFINALSPQQQKVVQFLSSNHKPQMGKAISRFCFIPPTTLSKQISELVDKGIIGKNKEGKDVYYELREPLMRICFEINEHSDGVAKLFIDFLKVIYSEEDLQRRYLQFKFGAQLQNETLKGKYKEEAEFYKKAIDKNVLLILNHPINTSNFENEEELIKGIENIISENKEKIQKNSLRVQFIESINQSFSINLAQKENLIQGFDAFSIETIEKLILINENGNEKIEEKLGTNLYNRLLQENRTNKNELYKDLSFFYKLIEEAEFINDAFVYNHIAKNLANDNHHKKAIKYYKIALSIDANLVESSVLLGWSLDKLQDYNAAVNAYNYAIDLNPEFPDIYFHKGNSLDNLGKLEEAIDCYLKALNIKPNDSNALSNIGLVYTKQKKFKKGIEYYLKSLELNSSNATTHFNLGLAYNEMNFFHEAINAFDNSISINKNDTAPHLYKGLSLAQLGKYEESIKSFNDVIKINPNYITAYLNKAQSLKHLNKHQNALEAYKKVVELEPNNLYFTYLQAHTYGRLGQYKKAISGYNRVILGNSKNINALYHRGCAHAEIRGFQLALEDFNKILTLNPNHAETISTKGRVFAILGNHKKAISLMERAMEFKPNDIEIINSLGISLAVLKKFDSAISVFEKGLKIDKENWFINGSLLNIHLSRNEIDKGKYQFELVFNLDNNKKYPFVDFLMQDNLYPLLKTTNLEVAKSYFQFLVKNLNEKQLLPELWKAFPKAIFNMLINIEDYSEDRLGKLNIYLKEEFKPYKEMTIPLLYLDIGIRYLKKGDKRAIYDFSKEERQIFQEFVLDKRTVKIM